MPSGTLVAILLPRPEAAAAVVAAWERGEAVAPLDPTAPPAVAERLLAAVRPTHVLDGSGRREWPGGDPPADGVVAVVVTSGTTGEPKAVELTAAGRAANAAGYTLALGGRPDDRWLCCLPMHHVSGLSIVGRAHVDGTGLVVHERFDLDAVATAPETEGATLMSVVPTMLRRLLDADAPLHRYRRIVVGGAPLPEALRRRAEAAGAPIVDAYGLTETWGGFTVDGAPLPDAEVRLSEAGEVLVRGPYVMRGYRTAVGAVDSGSIDTRPLDSDPIDADGFLHTGDLATMTDGRLRIVDRVDDLVISGGINVSPTAVEAALVDHPDIEDVGITGTPDPEWGEQIVAFVVPRPSTSPTLESLQSFTRDRLTAAQLPRRIVLVTSLPRTPGGKLLRRELRDRLGSS